MHKLEAITGVILVGGKSLRMGSDKALLEIGGVPLYSRILQVMERIFVNVILVGDRKYRFAECNRPVYPDIYPGSALGGLFSGLHHAPTEYVFVAPCDIPFPNEALIRHLCASAKSHDAVVPHTSAGLEPLFAVYGKTCLAPMKHLLDNRIFRIREFYRNTNVCYVDQNVIARFDERGTSFLNVNTPEEFARILYWDSLMGGGEDVAENPVQTVVSLMG
jgi:molybdopterin-guanine dinucleotide biosynthesis protein A